MLFICHPKCTTCLKARKWLDEKGISYEMRDIRQDNPNYEELKTWTALSGLPVRRFFNTSGQSYQALGLKDKLGGMDEEEQLRLLASDGMLVRRPLLIGQGIVLIGFKEQAWAESL